MLGYEDRVAILQGAGETILRLVCERSTPEQWAEWLRAPLEHAAGTANHELVKKLIKAGADRRACWRGCRGMTLVHASAAAGGSQQGGALLQAEAGSDNNTKNQFAGCSPLHICIAGGKEAAAKKLIMAGADVNVLDRKDDAPLHMAIEGGLMDTAQTLVLHGARQDVKGSKGEYPIHQAVCRGYDNIVHVLMQNGGDLDCLDAREWTPLRIAVHENHLSTVQLLLNGGADVNFQMTSAVTVLHVAPRYMRADIIHVLIEAGADIDARNSGGQTPLWYSAYQGSCTAMLALLQKGAKVNIASNHGWTPLHTVCQKGKPDAADLLLRWGADEKALSSSGKTPSARIPDIARAAEEDRPRLARLSKLLANAPQDRIWRRRGFLIMYRELKDRRRLRLVEDIPHAAAGAYPRPGEVEVKGARYNRESLRLAGRAGCENPGEPFGIVAAWLTVTNDDVFRKIVGFL